MLVVVSIDNPNVASSIALTGLDRPPRLGQGRVFAMMIPEFNIILRQI